MELTYRTVNGVQIPNLRLPKQKNLPIGKYGMMRHDFLEKYRKGTYTTLLTEFRLQEHLYEVDQEAKRQVEELTLLLVSGSGIDESLKNTDPLRWVQMINLAKKKCGGNRIERNDLSLKNPVGLPSSQREIFYVFKLE